MKVNDLAFTDFYILFGSSCTNPNIFYPAPNKKKKPNEYSPLSYNS